MDAPDPAGRWTRRRFLRAAGATVVGAAGLAAAAYELGRLGSGGPASSAASSPAELALASGSPRAAGATATVAGQRIHFRSRPDLVPPQIVVNVRSDKVAPGYIFFTPGNGAGTDGPMIADGAGDLVWLRPDTGRNATDFRAIEYLGRPALVWWEGSVNGGIGVGECVLVDQSYREILRVKGGGGSSVDLHEFAITPRGTALFFSDSGVAGRQLAGATPLPWQVLDCALQEVEISTGRLLFEWHTIDHIGLDETYLAPPTTGNAIYDYVHANSIDVDGDGNLLVSARNTSAIYKVDRGTGRIIWRLGGKKSDFRMGPGTAFSWQHDARWRADGMITIFDDETAPSQARGIILRLDEQAMTASLERSFESRTGLVVQSQGNVQVLPNGNYFIGWGSTPYFSEYGPDGTLLFDATFPAARQSYRDFRLPWVGLPADPPALAVEAVPAGGMTVYASWNGATEVASWQVLAGEAAGSLVPIATAARSGFETAIATARRWPLVAVRARDATGGILGTSEPVSVEA